MSFFSKFTRRTEEPSRTEPEAEAAEAAAESAAVEEPLSAEAEEEEVSAEPAPPPPPEVVIELEDNYDLDVLLRRLVSEGGSDLHLSVGMPPIFRIHGELIVSHAAPLTEERAHAILYPTVDEYRVAEFENCGNLDFAYEISGVARFRGNFFKQNRGMAAVFRVIPSKIPSLDEMHLPAVLKEIAMIKHGIVLVTGPTGSGKSTTLAAMIDYVNHNRQAHIITIEDPIEFTHTSDKCLIDHREVGANAHSFADAIRASLREDPDILLVGEMRDLDTIYNAIKAAETGALVFATLHTNSAAKTIDRIIDVFPAKQQATIRAMLSESFKAVVSQLLLKKQGGGRVAVHEILIAEAGFSNIIREGKTSQINNYIQTGKEFGMQSMDAGLLKLFKEKKISKNTVREFCHDPNFFRLAGVNLAEG
ncbi:type IV pilus twitching motility protein PilT [bacterium]|nr:type IV pilus twitching motility protein PilT [bacterium]